MALPPAGFGDLAMRRYAPFVLATLTAFLLAVSCSTSAIADCLPDPVRDVAFVNGHPPICRSTFDYTFVLNRDREGSARTTITFEFGRNEFVDGIPPWLYVAGYNRPYQGDPAPERIEGLGRPTPRTEFGVIIFRTKLP